MSEPELTKRADDPPRDSRRASFLRRKLAYIAVLALAVAGVAYTNVSQRPLIGYWEFLALATGPMRRVGMGKRQQPGRSPSTDVDPGAPLGCHSDHDEYRAVVCGSEYVARAGDEPRRSAPFSLE